MNIDRAEKPGRATSAPAIAPLRPRARTWWSSHWSAQELRRARRHGAASELVGAGEGRQGRLWALHLVAEEAVRRAAPTAAGRGRADVSLRRAHGGRDRGYVDRVAVST